MNSPHRCGSVSRSIQPKVLTIKNRLRWDQPRAIYYFINKTPIFNFQNFGDYYRALVVGLIFLVLSIISFKRGCWHKKQYPNGSAKEHEFGPVRRHSAILFLSISTARQLSILSRGDIFEVTCFLIMMYFSKLHNFRNTDLIIMRSQIHYRICNSLIQDDYHPIQL